MDPRKGLLAAALCMGLAQTAAAQEDREADQDISGVRPKISVGGRGAFIDPRGADGSWFGGLQLRFPFTERWAAETSFDYRRTETSGLDVDVFPAQVSLLAYLLPERSLKPFLLAGGGWYYTKVESPGGATDYSNRFGPHVGGGAEIFFLDRWSVDATYRYIWLQDVDLESLKFRDEGHMITAGLNYHF